MSDSTTITPTIALVCLSNLNRSMEAHNLFIKNGYNNIKSYGTGTNVKLPGETVNTPNVYEFNTPYTTILNDLKKKNQSKYERNGMLRMLERDSLVKNHPEKWIAAPFDLVISFDLRVYESIVSSYLHKVPTIIENFIPEHIHVVNVINVETKDTHQEAANGASTALSIMDRISKKEDSEDITSILDEVERQTGFSLLHSTMYYC